MDQQSIGMVFVCLCIAAVAVYNFYTKFQNNIENRIADSKKVSEAILKEADRRYLAASYELQMKIGMRDAMNGMKEELKSTATSSAAVVSSNVQMLKDDFASFRAETTKAGKETSVALAELASLLKEHIKYHKDPSAQWNSSHSKEAGDQAMPL